MMTAVRSCLFLQEQANFRDLSAAIKQQDLMDTNKELQQIVESGKPVNYGYVEGVIGGDGSEQDIYLLGETSAVKDFTGKVIAVYHRYDDNETKWIVVPCDEEGNIQSSIKMPGKNAIYAQIAFQEQFYSGVLVGV